MVTRCEPARWRLQWGCRRSVSSAGARGVLQGSETKDGKLAAKFSLLPEEGENVKCGHGRGLGRGIGETDVPFVSSEKKDDGEKCDDVRTCGGMLLRAASALVSSVKRHGPGLEPRLVHFQLGLDDERPHLRPLYNKLRRIRDDCCTLLKLISAVIWWCCLSAATDGVEAEEENQLLDEERDEVPFLNVLNPSPTPTPCASVVRPLRAIIGEVGDNEECDQQVHARLLRREDIDYVAATGDGSADFLDTFVHPPQLTSANGDGEAGGVHVVGSEAAGEDAGDNDEDEDEDEEEGDGDGDGDGNCEDLGSPGRPIRVGKITPRDYQDTINEFPPLYEV
jgi:hypothetical protein